MSRLEDAVRDTEGGVALELEVQPGARSEGFPAGFNPWRRRIQARVKAAPQDGEANEALTGLVAAFFEVPRAQVTVAHGGASRQKTVVVRGVAWRDALTRLQEGLKVLQ